MVSNFDEYLVHQTEQPLAKLASEHPEWQDRFYFNIHDRNGEFHAMTGLGAYPNRNMMQGYLFVVHKGQHYAYLNARALANDREVMQTGSLAFTVADPLKSWNIEVADEANDIRASLGFRARCPLYLFSPIRWQNGDRLVANQMHYTQAGVYDGTLTIGDTTFTDLIGIRDRSWGVRDMPRVPMWIWISAQFREFCISAWLWETPEGELIHADGALTYEAGDVRPITGIEHELELWSGTKRPKRGRYGLTLASGEKLSLTADGIATVFLGPVSSRWSDDDEEALARADAASFGFDQYCWFKLGDETGIGIVEYMMTGGSKRYDIPPMKLGA